MRMFPSFPRRALLTLGLAGLGCLLSPTASPLLAAEPAAGTTVRFTTDDGLSIAATWFSAGAEGGPAVVLLPMYGGARTSWRLLVPSLLDRGLGVLTVDPRGHGESAVQGDVNLAGRVKARDGALFAEMHRDVEAAARWLVEAQKRDAKRIALVGASVGASVALDTARLNPDLVAAVLALTPGPRFLGMDSVAHAEALRADLPVAFLVHKDEHGDVTRPVWTALTGKRVDAAPHLSRLRILDMPPPPGAVSSKTLFHGVRMLGAAPLLEDWIADWLAGALGADPDAVLLDGEIADEEVAGTGAWARLPSVSAPEGARARAALKGTTRLVVGGALPEGATRLTLWLHVRRGDPSREGGHAFGNLQATFGLPDGEMVDGTTDASSAPGWQEPPFLLVTGRPSAGSRPFEGAVRLPSLPAEGPIQAWVAVGYEGGDGKPVSAPGAKVDDPATWTEVTRP